ncbi:Uncharacterised protein [Klebsiella pneumoniae]|uniref:hypothetical protein n=1 Tax=Klebsiella pneumoniae TaxID=573 RepID=UPI000E2D8455|nr:hypothetical protein [Klebsiella pneumoniae]SXX06930.1 Uncharacterised protein [Klebsiella pneumoniae]
MTITLQAVNELIASLESAGELSIRETKVMALAKAYQQMAAENVALKQSERELDNTCAEEFGQDWVSEFTETPATDRIVAEAEARGVEKAIAHLEKKFSNIGVQIMNLQWLADSLREGADK